MRELVFGDRAGARLGGQIRKTEGGDRRGIDERDRTAVRFTLVLRELEQVQRPLDVDMVRRDRRELGSGREQRRQVKDAVDLELAAPATRRAG
jgi:hypothetical protein